MTKKRKRLPAGPGGPASLRSTRAAQIDATSTAIIEACDHLLSEGSRPTISQVVAVSRYSASTVNRERYRSLVRAARACFDLMESGMALTEARAIVGRSMPPAVEAAAGGTEPEEVADLVPREVALALMKKVERLTAELERRDRQLEDTLAAVASLRTTVAWHRTRTAELQRQIEALSNAPLPARKPKRWSDDLEAQGTEIDDEDD